MKHLLYIGNRLSRHGWSPTTIETLGPLLAESYAVVYASDRKNKWERLFHMAVVFLREVRRTDCVLIDTYSTLNFWYAVLISQLARLFGVPYVPILHGGTLPDRLRRSPGLSRLVFGHSYANVAPSGYLRQAFEAAGYPTVLIPNFIHIEHYPFRRRRGLRPRLLWVRSFARLYNPKLAVEVLAGLARTHPEARLCMVGPDKDGSLAECRALARELGVADRIDFPGLLPKAEWVRLAQDYDLFLNTTNFDNTPVSVMEAMALGMAVVSTEVGGVPYLVEDQSEGLLAPPDDRQAMLAAVVRLIHEPDLALKLSRRAREKAETFDAEVVVGAWKRLLEEGK